MRRLEIDRYLNHGRRVCEEGSRYPTWLVFELERNFLAVEWINYSDKVDLILVHR